MLLSNVFFYMVMCSIIGAVLYARQVVPVRVAWQRVWNNRPGRAAAIVLAVFVFITLVDSIPVSNGLSLLDWMIRDKIWSDWSGQVGYLRPFLTVHHILGTNKIGEDIFYESIKSIRTAVLMGTVTTLFMLPFALILGMLAGFFGGWVDVCIQFMYTILGSIPSVLLISASILVLDVYIAGHPGFFSTMAGRADIRLLSLCAILGMTSWSNLCRLLRAETLKLRELEFVHAARVLGVGRGRIICRHIMPNLMHIVLITVVLDFSTFVLAEAVLSYVGVGVDPSTPSWGNMLNSARFELARDPVVWWPLASAMLLMFTLILAANIFADAVRDAFDPQH